MDTGELGQSIKNVNTYQFLNSVFIFSLNLAMPLGRQSLGLVACHVGSLVLFTGEYATFSVSYTHLDVYKRQDQ